MRTTALGVALLAARQASAANYDVAWGPGASSELASIKVIPGDTLTFIWTYSNATSGNHTIYEVSKSTYDSCTGTTPDFSSDTLVGSATSSPLVYTVGNPSDQATPLALRFASDVPGDCADDVRVSAEFPFEECETFERDNEDPCSGVKLKCKTSDPYTWCQAGEYCIENEDTGARACSTTPPATKKNSSDCPSTANTATAPMSTAAAEAKVTKLEDMAEYMEAMKNYIDLKIAYNRVTACKAVSTAWAAASCNSSATCTTNAKTACCAGQNTLEKSSCDDAASDWKEGVVSALSGLTNYENETYEEGECCDLCIGDSSTNPAYFAANCNDARTVPVTVCNGYQDSGEDKFYCGEPLEYINAAGQKPTTNGNLNLDPFITCSNTKADIEAAFAMVKTKATEAGSEFTRNTLTRAAIEDALSEWTDAELDAVFGPLGRGLAGYFMSNPTFTATAEADAPNSLNIDAGTWNMASLAMGDYKDGSCNTCAAMLNYPTLNANISANGAFFFINKANVYAGNSLSFGGSASAWITNTENHASITATTTGALMLHGVENTGTITATGIKGAVLSEIKNSGTVTLTDVIGNGLAIENKAGGTITFAGNCKVAISFAEAKGTITFASTVTGTVDVPAADAGNVDVTGAAGLTKTCDGSACDGSGGSGSGASPSSSGDDDDGSSLEEGAVSASIGAGAAAVGCMAAAALMQ